MDRSTLNLDPAWPLLQVAALGLAAVAAAVWLYGRGPGLPERSRGTMLAVLRGLAVAGIAVLLLNPVHLLAQRDTTKPPLLVLLDTSPSMAVADAGGRPRFEAAAGLLFGPAGLLQEYGRQFTPILFSLAENAARQPPDSFAKTARPDGARTRLGEGLASALDAAGSGSGGVLLLSDGRNNGETNPVEVAKQARTRGFPVFTVCLGTTAHGRDASVLSRVPQVYGAPDQEIPLSGEVRSIGFDGRTAQVQLLREGQPVEQKSVTLADGHPVPVSFSAREAKPGSYRYTLALAPLPGKTTASNNRSSALLRVLNARTRVLVLEGRPTWDAKFLIQALHTDPSVDLDAIFKLSGDKFFAVKGASDTSGMPQKQVKVPSTPEELAKYDVVIIGKGFEEFFTSATADALKRYVSDHAGNLIFLRGRAEERAATLEALEPVKWSEDQVRDFRMKVTEEGLSNPAFGFHTGSDPQTVVQKLPTMISATRVEGEKSLAVVLARASGVATPGVEEKKEMAVLAYHSYGQGKVVSLVGQGLWRWAFLPPDLKEYAGCYNDFWTQLVRWLVSQSDFLPGQELTLKTDRTSYSPGDTVHLMAFARGQMPAGVPPLKITGPDGKSQEIALAKGAGTQADLSAAFKPRQPGEYLVSLAVRPTPTGTIIVPFSVYQTREEDVLTAADPVLMRQIAEAGGGAALSADELKSLPQKLRDARSLLLTRTEPRSVWDRWWVLAALLGLLSSEWVLRRRWGLV